MTKDPIMRGAAAAVLVVLALAVGYRTLERYVDPATAPSPTPSASTATAAHPSFLYGRIATVDGTTYEGRLRFGGDEEAYWGDYFNGVKDENPWVAHVPPDQLPEEHRPIEILGVEIPLGARRTGLGRPLMARFGDIATIEARGRNLWVTLKSGTMHHLDRYAADDFADGVRVWDGERGVVDLDERQIRSIELLPPARPGTVRSGTVPPRLHGTVRTQEGDFTGFLQWDREKGIGSDALDGYTADGERLGLRFDAIRSITRHANGGVLVTRRDGREVVLSGTREVGPGHRGIYVDDPRYGRVLVSWDAFERVDFSPGGSGPSYGDFPPGRPLTGGVTTRTGRRLAGRLVFDLDESETTETLDAPSRGVDYTLPFGLVASIVLPSSGGSAAVTLQSGEVLRLERAGDLGEDNAGLLVFADGRERAEYVPWSDVEQVDFDRPPAMYPPVSGR